MSTFASISSGSCNQLVPLAEDLKVLNLMWDCGTPSILEARRTATASAPRPTPRRRCWRSCIYLLKTKPDFKTIAVVNQDYAWGRESWEIFSTALKR